MKLKNRKNLLMENRIIKFSLAICFLSVSLGTIIPFVINDNEFKAFKAESFASFPSAIQNGKGIECSSLGEEGLICESENITIENLNKNILPESETKLLIQWFEENVWFGPEITDLEKIIISDQNCVVQQELDCGGLTNFFDSGQTTIELYLQRIVSNEKNFEESLTRALNFRDLTYYLAHEYYHHISQISLFDITSENEVVDGAGIELEGENFAFAIERNKEVVQNFMVSNNLITQSNNLSGTFSRTCPLSIRSKSDIYKSANQVKKDTCNFFLTLPSLNSAIEKTYYPKINQLITPTSLTSCGYLSNETMDWNSLQYYFNIDEIIVRQLLLMTYVDPSSKLQLDGKINCYLPTAKATSSVGPTNQMVFDYFIMYAIGLLPFQNVVNFDYASATSAQIKIADSINETLLKMYQNDFFRINDQVGYLFYENTTHQFQIGGYLDYDSTLNTFFINDESSKWVIDKLVLQEDDGTQNELNIYPKGQIRSLKTFNAANPTTRKYDSDYEQIIDNRRGYITEPFKPQQKDYKMFYSVKKDGQAKLIEVSSVTNNIARVNKGNISVKRNYKVEKNDKGVYATFTK